MRIHVIFASLIHIIHKHTYHRSQVIGGPAYNCQVLDRGDVILKIDGIEVDEDNLLTYLIGNDVPGSQVTVTVMKMNQKVKTNKNNLSNSLIFGRWPRQKVNVEVA